MELEDSTVGAGVRARSVRRSALLWLLLALVLAGLASAQPPPRLERVPGGIELTALPPVLAENQVREHLRTGLTTTFLFRITGRDEAGRRVQGASRVEVRFELWDEVYQLAALGLDGRLQRYDSPTFDDLLGRWRGLRLPVLADPTEGRGGRVDPLPNRFDVRLDVIPFSRGEQRDTQRWFSESIDRSGSNAEKAGRVSEDRPEALGDALHLLMATSIKRRAMLDYSWQVPVLPAREPGP